MSLEGLLRVTLMALRFKEEIHMDTEHFRHHNTFWLHLHQQHLLLHRQN